MTNLFHPARPAARWPDLPVLLATGRVDQEALALAHQHSHTVRMPKPYSIDELRHPLWALVARPGTVLAQGEDHLEPQAGLGAAQ
jgi:hypothetical protein